MTLQYLYVLGDRRLVALRRFSLNNQFPEKCITAKLSALR